MKSHSKKLLLASLLVGTFAVVNLAFASSTIGTDISTAGILSVMGTATSTIANLQVGGATQPSAGTTFLPDYSLLVLNTPLTPDYSEIVLASKSDGFAGNQYDWGFVAQNGDVNPNGSAATAGALVYIGSIWMQRENTTTASSTDWGFDIGSSITNRPLMGNSIGDVGIGMTDSSYGGAIPTPITTASIFVSGTTRNVGIGTTSPATRLQVSNGASATTTITIGELGLSSSKGCVNMNRSNGGPGSFYLNAAGTLVSEPNYCK